VVLCSLSACRGRTILGGGKDGKDKAVEKNDKKLVVGTMVKPALTPLAGAEPAVSSGAGPAVTIWFTRVLGEKVEYFARVKNAPGPLPDTAQTIAFAVKELLAGPEADSTMPASSSTTTTTTSSSDSGDSGALSTEIPRGTVLIKVVDDPKSGVITVDLSRRFIQGGGMDSFEARLEQLRRTVGAITLSRPVFLNVEGQRLTASDDGLEVKQPICGGDTDTAASSALTN